jgi:ABC-type multidrug transport system fused ATPase/permease subunit
LQNMTSLLTSFIVAFIVEWRVSLLILGTFPLLVLANFAQVNLTPIYNNIICIKKTFLSLVITHLMRSWNLDQLFDQVQTTYKVKREPSNFFLNGLNC